MPKIEKAVLLHDGDIFAYRAASATDGRQYVVSYKCTMMTSDGARVDDRTEKIKYKKEADIRAAELRGTVDITYEPEPLSHALHIITNLVQQVPRDLLGRADIVGSEHFLTASGSFREKMEPSYKVNRSLLRRPEHLKACKEFLAKKYDAACKDGEYEADDLLAIRMTYWQKLDYNPICVSIDKDLKQVAGWHWDFVKKKLLYVSPLEGMQSFYRQLLTGDTTDGILGIKGIGPVGAAKLINHLTSEFDMYVACLREWLKYLKQGHDEDPMVYMNRVVTQVRINARLLYLLRDYGKHWEEPDEEVARLSPTL